MSFSTRLRSISDFTTPTLTLTFFALSSVILINDKLLETVSVRGNSMAPTLSPHYHETGRRDHILLQKYQPAKNLQRGDVIAFHLPHKPDGIGIKRVVALEGDCVTMDWKRRPQNEEEDGGVGMGEVWDAMGEAHERGVGKRRVRVPYGHVWVEGDNWRQSQDSNHWGPLSKSMITGKGICLVNPSRFLQKPWETTRSKTKVSIGENARPLAWEDL